ncbi:ParB/RepB/Spo0J family partition protein [Mucilaginibacter sp. SMC90]|uniref:ParB/RepB/Spo0J family partition protein n=1 Tax=Mucilaginibacter sp. SMC90 TaxID=2929803 RepID=UPI001FB3150A|nr:ParB/RepB/Spo0J family partition protein [Mucilaginibacter sp. SMC90]UOE51313.1 ParB/RepB/Spo0J family partition protein [Mucilaginibacter sp. SMC90]
MSTLVKSPKGGAKNKTASKRATLKRTFGKNRTVSQGAATQPIKAQAVENGEQIFIAVKQLHFSPLNYRKLYSQSDLDSFAIELAVHGIISPLTVRKSTKEGYELVVGERRLRAARIAKISEVPVVVKEYTDEQVIEIQLAENMQREDPHPLHEAQHIALLQSTGKTIDEIALRLGKSKAFIYNRIRLSQLIAPMQEVFINDKIGIQDALEIATLATESQQEFFDEYCSDWQNNKSVIGNVRYFVSKFKYDLKNAPFNVRNKSLVPDMGACTGCPFNSATIKTLFPELAKEAVCNNKACFKNKCLAQAEINIRKVIKEVQPDALLKTANIPADYQIIIDSLPETAGLPEYSYYDIKRFFKPEMPQEGTYTLTTDKGKTKFDKKGYNAALQEYNDNLAAYEEAYQNSENLKGLYVSFRETQIVLFNPAKQNDYNQTKVTAKEVQEAIKAGTVTPELLEAEIERITTKEKRSKEIDLDKIQLQVHGLFKSSLFEMPTEQVLTAADLTGARLLVYQSLDYLVKRNADAFLLGEQEYSKEALYAALQNMTEQQFCYLIRLAVAAKSESQYPGNVTGYCLYQMASEAGTDVQTVEAEQAAKASEREAKINPRIEDLQNRIAEMREQK